MSLTPSLYRFRLIGLLMLLTGVGCSDFESSFVYSKRTLDLMPQAQDGTKENPGVKKLLDDRFGNPQNLKAWLKLPIDFGGTNAQVGDFVQPKGESAKLRLSIEEGSTLPAKATSIQFTGGACAGETVAFSAWDAATGEATLEDTLAHQPAAGDPCVIDGGAVLKSGRVLYMRHCSHCHGTSGDGEGPTAQYLNPRPRDYRHGVFKFKSTNDQSKVSREDLKRVLKYGIPGTYMPSFLLLEEDELHAIVEYVRFLAVRGEYERKLVTELAGDFSKVAMEKRVKDGEKKGDIVQELTEILAADLKEAATSLGDDLNDAWSAADTEESRIVPNVARVPDSPESRRRGRELFLSKTLNCADCHGMDGDGNGPQTIAYEKNPITGDLYEEPGLHDDWDNLNQPRNLKTGIYRGGRRPIDLFSRIHGGIKGSRMPSFKNTPHEDIWNIVNYVLSVPFESEPGATGVPAAVPVNTVPAEAAAADAAPAAPN